MVRPNPANASPLDIVRGIAVMGILAMNIVAFAMPFGACQSDRLWRRGAIDFASYAFNFVLIDRKMRGLFSFLFGASMLLVIRRPGPRASPRRCISAAKSGCCCFGALHFYLIWFGDICSAMR
jgi:uncharacterized protein